MSKTVLFLTAALLGFAPMLAHAADTAPVPVSSSASTPVPASSAAPTVAPVFTDAQRAEIENIIKEYITEKNPQVLAQGMQKLQDNERKEADAKTKSAVDAAKDRIYSDPHTPTVGNVKAPVTIVEFYDYQCGYCKMSEEGLEKTIKENKNVRVVYKDFPILGAVSVEAAKASLASVKQDKFQPFHDALMSKKDHLTSDMIYQTAKDVGLNVDKLKKDMEDALINDVIAANLKLGQDIGVRGTPMFIVNDMIYPGALQYDELKKAVSDAAPADKKS